MVLVLALRNVFSRSEKEKGEAVKLVHTLSEAMAQGTVCPQEGGARLRDFREAEALMLRLAKRLLAKPGGVQTVTS